MKKLYKFVSGVGKVELSADEIKNMENSPALTQPEPLSLSELSQKVDSILKALGTLKILSSLGTSEDESNGNS